MMEMGCWGMLIKGVIFIVAPGFVDKAGDWEVKTKFIPVAGIAMLAIGAYLSWIGYFV